MPTYSRDLVCTKGGTWEDREGVHLDFVLSVIPPEGAPSHLITQQIYADSVLDPSDDLVALMKYGNKITMSFGAVAATPSAASK